MNSFPLYTVDAFSKTMFGGNQAAVCLVGSRKLTESTMQNMASEMSLSETAYLESNETIDDLFRHGSQFNIRWFTPNTEVPLCGHATLASAAVLFNECGNVNEEITFHSLGGDLKARKSADGITLDFPSNEAEKVELGPWSKLLKATLNDTYKDIKSVFIAPQLKYLLVVMNERHAQEDLESIKPNFDEMMKIHDGSQVVAVIVTTKGTIGTGYDFVSRFFDPWLGDLEDPVTGSAHTVLGPYWMGILGKSEFNARQCSKRGGDMKVVVRQERVFLTGSAVTVVRGNVNLCS